ncbi:2-amino-3,7-dideoxy-D-threo-hept-6-ulosonate synthase [Nocardiopsis rhodophaea]
MDHSITNGPLGPTEKIQRLIETAAGNGVDAVVLHKGRVRSLGAEHLTRVSLIMHLSASTMHAPDSDSKCLVSSVEEAARMGADAVSVHVNLGSADERRQVADLAAVADASDRWGMPLLAMVYPRGPEIAEPRAPELVAHAATVAADLGADIVKTHYTGDAASMADVVRSCPIPVIVAGGPRRTTLHDLDEFVSEAMLSGVRGVAMGRNVFDSEDPGAAARVVAGRVHPQSRRLTPTPT